MPLQVSSLAPAALAKTIEQEIQSSKQPVFVVVYAGVVDGRMWCGDCRDAAPFVERKFAVKDAKLIYVGNKPTWRDLKNPWRKPPFAVEKLPTLIKITSEGKWHRLVEEDVYNQSKLDDFVDSN